MYIYTDHHEYPTTCSTLAQNACECLAIDVARRLGSEDVLSHRRSSRGPRQLL
jgi:hypothetical protein